jgi:cyclic pyranopterin phosphate synthase
MLEEQDTLTPLGSEGLGNGPARYFRMETMQAIVGFIGAMTDLHFCEGCNKVRLTADGKIRPCLGNHDEHDLKPVLRGGGGIAAVRRVLGEALAAKPPGHLFRSAYRPGRPMVGIGG